MKKKIIIFFILISATFLFSMQLCSLIFGSAPTVSITSPANSTQISDASLNVRGTILDPDGDQSYVEVWIDNHLDTKKQDNDVTTGQFTVDLDLSSLPSGSYNILAKGYDANGNSSNTVTVSITYQRNLLINGNFASYIDYYDYKYENNSQILTYLNKADGDWLEGWVFSINEIEALDNKIKIDLNGTSLVYYSTVQDGNGYPMKMSILQDNINHTVTSNTKLYIKFKIEYEEGGPGEGALKILFNNNTQVFVSFSTLIGGTDPGSEFILDTNQIYEHTLPISDFQFSSGAIPVGNDLISLRIFVNCQHWKVTIYEIKIFEDQ